MFSHGYNVLYTYPENFRAYKALIAAKYSGADVRVASDFVFGETNKSEAFLEKFPAGKVPAFESSDGEVLLTESNAIAYYVSSPALRGVDATSAAGVWQWCCWADGEVLPAAAAWVFPVLGIMPGNKAAVDRARTDLLQALALLDRHLLTRTFLVGERLTLADIVLFCTLLHSYQHVLDPKVRSQVTNVTRWFNTLLHQPEVSSVIPALTLCSAPPQIDHTKFQNIQKQKKEGAPKKEQKKKDAPKKETTKPKSEEVEEEEEIPAPALVGFDMDDFKRCYSNEDEAKSIPYFWQKFDPDNYSIWMGTYKYPEELTKVFMSCNLITGMFQRLDKMRKQAFASVCLFGDDKKSSISGVWVWKGHELAFTQSPDWQIDYESYDWKKLDPNSEATKALVQQYFSWSGKDAQGLPFNQGKIFK